ncbi:hypothetical protein AAMO2058_001556500 [Amorphochlora amoebiformis]
MLSAARLAERPKTYFNTIVGFLFLHNYAATSVGGVVKMVSRRVRISEAPGSIPGISNFLPFRKPEARVFCRTFSYSTEEIELESERARARARTSDQR